MKTEPAPPNILVVDDTPANLHLLVALLSEHGHKVRPVTSGELALRAARASAPDVILLDVAMPGMDGYEVCRRLKADEKLQDIPVIFLSAHTELEDRIRAFEAGGVDYISKPFRVEEVMARVNAHVTIRRQREQLASSYRQLRELERMRDTLTHMVAHDMRSPLLALNLSIDCVGAYLAAGKAGLVPPVLDNARLALQNLIRLVTQMLDVSRLESGEMRLTLADTEVAPLLAEAAGVLKPAAGARRLLVEGGQGVTFRVDKDLIHRVITNLLANAIKFTGESGTVVLRSVSEGARTRIEVQDDGAGIVAADQKRIFEKFGQVDGEKRHAGYGLGLAFVRMAVEAHGGIVGVESDVGRGSRFWFSI